MEIQKNENSFAYTNIRCVNSKTLTLIFVPFCSLSTNTLSDSHDCLVLRELMVDMENCHMLQIQTLLLHCFAIVSDYC